MLALAVSSSSSSTEICSSMGFKFDEETVKIKFIQDHFWCERGRRKREMGASARVLHSKAKAAHMGSGKVFFYCSPAIAGRDYANSCLKIRLLSRPDLGRSVI